MAENVSQKKGGNSVLPSQRTRGGCAELAFRWCGVSPLVWFMVYTKQISVDTKTRMVGLRYGRFSGFHSAGERYIPPPLSNGILQKCSSRHC